MTETTERPDYSQWLLLPNWSGAEALLLAVGRRPPDIEDRGAGAEVALASRKARRLSKLKDEFISEVRAGGVPVEGLEEASAAASRAATKSELAWEPVFLRGVRVRPWDFLQWAVPRFGGLDQELRELWLGPSKPHAALDGDAKVPAATELGDPARDGEVPNPPGLASRRQEVKPVFRLEILEAALAVLAIHHETCTFSKGRPNASAIAEKIMAHRTALFSRDNHVGSKTVIANEIRDAMKKLKDAKKGSSGRIAGG